MKIPFDIKYRPQIESGEYKVKTKDGKQVRIVSWDKEGFECQEIVALVTNATGTESCNIYTINGFLRSNYYQRNMNLFIVTPEEELTEFENELATVIGFAIAQSVSSPNEKMVEFVKNWSERLLSLAREQLIKDGYVIEKKAFHDAVENISDKHLAEMSVQYSLHCKIEDGTRHAIMNWVTFQKVAQKFIDIGKDEALKDLPRWKKVGLDTGQTTLMVGYTSDEDKLYRNGYVISLTDLEKLPKEEK